MKKIVIAFVFSFVAVFHGNAEIDISAKEAFAYGNEAYKNGDFEEALEFYEMAATEMTGFAIYYNLGNTYYRLKKYPESILYFEKALKFKPGNEDARYNLSLANSRIPDKIENFGESKMDLWWKEFKYGAGPDGWARISIILSAGVILLLVWFYFAGNRNLRRFTFYGAIILFAAMIGAIYFAHNNENFQNQSVAAIIFAKRVDIKSEPRTEATTVFILHEGTKVKFMTSEDNWYKVRIADGKEGWIKAEHIKEI